MKLWIFNHYAIAPGSSGGTRHYDVSKELVKRNYDVSIFASSFDHFTRQEAHIHDAHTVSREDMYDGVRFVWVKTFAYRRNDWRRVINMLSYTYRAYRVALQRDEVPDVIIGSLMHPLAALLGYRLAKKKKCKFYFEERDLWPQSLIDLGKVSANNPIVSLLGRLELFLYKKADRIIVLFDKAVDYVAQRGIAREKVLYLSNGVDLSRYDQLADALPEEHSNLFQALSGKFIAFYLGSHGLANNLDDLLDTAKRLKEEDGIHFVFVGHGPEKDRLIKRKQEEGLTNVSFASPVLKEQVPALLQRADVGLIAMKDAEVYKWGISLNKMYDYMAASLPILIQCKMEQTPIETQGCGLKSETPQEMADAIRLLFDNRAVAEEMGRKSRAYVEQHHAWTTLSRVLAETMEADVTS